MTPTWMVLAGLATYRATLLVTDDALTEGSRERVRRWLSGHGLVPGRGDSGVVECECGDVWQGPGTYPAAEVHVHTQRQRVTGWRGKALTLLGCPWCASVWLGAAVVGAGYLADGAVWWEAGALLLAVSAVTGLGYRAAHP